MGKYMLFSLNVVWKETLLVTLKDINSYKNLKINSFIFIFCYEKKFKPEAPRSL